jgi:hypothetical protein
MGERMTRPIITAPCVWCLRDCMEWNASFNGGDICADCEEEATNGGDSMTETETLEALEKLALQIDELRASMPEDSKRAEQLQDAYYLVRDAIANE